MSDEHPPEAGSRRRRREIREARERERAAQRESESAVRRLSSSSTADSTSGGSRGGSAPEADVFDQETTTPKDERRSRPSGGAHSFVSRRERRRMQAQRSKLAEESEPTEQNQPVEPTPVTTQEPAPVTPSSPSTPFEEVVAPRSADSPATSHTEQVSPDDYPLEYDEEYEDLGWYGEYDDEHIDHDHDGTPILVGASDYGRGYQTVAPVGGRVDRELLKRRKAKRRRRNITLTVALLGFAALMIAFVVIVQSLLGEGGEQDYDTIAGDEVEFEIYPNEGLASVRDRLVDEEIIASSEAFQAALEDYDGDPTHHADTFILNEQMPAADALDVFFEGGAEVDYININAGQRIDEALEAIASGTQVSLDELEELNQEPQQFGLPDEADDLEGFLAPGEYRPDIDATAEDVIEMVVAPTFERLDEADVAEEDQWETMIIASLITAEANNVISDERPREERMEDYRTMAGAIENRIQNPEHDEIDGLLQIDAAVHYGTGSTGDLHFDDATREDESNPYNTYQHPGLPPGPIAAPIADTIAAAADPADTDAYYWVTVNPATGETRFNNTYEAHQEDTEEFVQFCEDNEDACGEGDVESAEEELDE